MLWAVEDSSLIRELIAGFRQMKTPPEVQVQAGPAFQPIRVVGAYITLPMLGVGRISVIGVTPAALDQR